MRFRAAWLDLAYIGRIGTICHKLAQLAAWSNLVSKRKHGPMPVQLSPSSHPPRLPSPTAGTLVSASWDHSVRLWDVEAGAASETFNHNKAVHCVGAAPGGQGLVAFGGAERALRVRALGAGAGWAWFIVGCLHAGLPAAGCFWKCALCILHARLPSPPCTLLRLSTHPFLPRPRLPQVWDPRMRSSEGLAVKACSSHTGWISAVAWHPASGANLSCIAQL